MDRNNKMVNKIIISMFSFLPFFLYGCNGKEPVKNDLIGNWVSSDGAVISLKKDGTFTAKNLSVSFFILDEYKEKQFNGSGEWTLKKGKNFWEVYLGFNEISNSPYSYGHTVFISGENGVLENKPPWYLFVWKEEAGGDRYEFKRK